MSNLQDLTAWAVPQLSSLLPLPEDELRQVVAYAATSPDLSGPSAIATHFTDLLGSSAECLAFIEEFNRRRFPAAASSSSRPKPYRDDSNAPPRSNRKAPKKKDHLNRLPPVRKVDNSFASSSEDLSSKLYRKDDLEDYMTTNKPKKPTLTPTSRTPSQGPSRSTTPNPPPHIASAAPPSLNVTQKQPAQQGTLTSDLLGAKKKTQKAKLNTVAIPAGPTMRPPSSTLSDITSALRTLEIHTNPTISSASADKRKCNCSGRIHDLLLAAPNCLNCGKIICIKEGLAPCTFCGRDLISSDEMEAMRRVLRDEQSKEKMNAHNASHKKAGTTKTLDVYASKVNPSAGGSSVSGPTPGSAALSSAMEQRDKLLGFQSSSAKRTRIIDQAADWETPDAGVNMWATPQERALQLREQQRKMRELEWDGKEDWEKRRVVVSIDLKGKKVSKEMRSIERPKFEIEEDKKEEEEELPTAEKQAPNPRQTSGGTFSRNPLLAKGLIKPKWKAEDETGGAEDVRRTGSEPDAEFGEWGKALRSGWRRVQDDMTDNERYILDGGRLARPSTEVEKSTEPPCG